MQDKIKVRFNLTSFYLQFYEFSQKDPSTALLLKATFMKLSSIMNAPMVRIIQANSQDFVSVSKYYSGELIKFVKEVLQVIKKILFFIISTEKLKI